MKCVCISCFDNYDTRMGQVLNLFEAQGYETTYITSDFDHVSKQKIMPRDSDPVIRIRVPPYKKNIAISRLASHLWFSWKVWLALRRIRPDIVYCMIPPNSLVRAVAAWRKHCPTGTLALDFYDMWPESLPLTDAYSKMLALMLKQWANMRDRHYGQADRILCVSEDCRLQLKAAGCMQDIVVLPPVLAPLFRDCWPKSARGELSVLYLGNINTITDIDLGVELLKTLSKYVKVTMHLIGQGEKQSDFINRLESHGVDCVTYGIVSDRGSKRAIASKCDFGLNIPKIEVRSSIALKFVEYLSMGLPVINSGIGDAWEIVDREHFGINVTRSDVAEAASMILRADFDSIARNIISEYNKVLGVEHNARILQQIISGR